MKNIFLISCIAFISFAFKFQGRADALINALKNGNAEDVTNYFDGTVDMKLPKKEEVNHMGKSQATTVFKSFFADNAIKGFEVSSQRQIGNTMYLAGKLKNNGKGFTITMMLQQQGGREEIISVRIN